MLTADCLLQPEQFVVEFVGEAISLDEYKERYRTVYPELHCRFETHRWIAVDRLDSMSEAELGCSYVMKLDVNTMLDSSRYWRPTAAARFRQLSGSTLLPTTVISG